MRKAIILIYIILITMWIGNSTAISMVRIGILDSGLAKGQYDPKFLCTTGHYGDYRNPPNAHGTNIYNLVTANLDPKKYCVEYYTTFQNNIGLFGGHRYRQLLTFIRTRNIDYINLSYNGEDSIRAEFGTLLDLLNNGTKVFVAAGNSGEFLDAAPSYPAAYRFKEKNFVVIGNTSATSNYGTNVDFYVDGNDKGKPKMSGSSQSCAIALNMTIRGLLNVK